MSKLKKSDIELLNECFSHNLPQRHINRVYGYSRTTIRKYHKLYIDLNKGMDNYVNDIYHRKNRESFVLIVSAIIFAITVFALAYYFINY